MAMQIFIDESGFTGEDLFSPEQPIFSVASTNLSTEEADAICGTIFSRTQAAELKHSTLVRSSRGQALVVELVKYAVGHKNQFTAYLAHKRFCLLSKLVDLWLESAMHEDGVDLYEAGGNIAFANMAYFCLEGFESQEFLARNLDRFQRMMRERTAENYVQFWGSLDSDRQSAKEETAKILDFFFLAEAKLGFTHLLELKIKSLDIAFPIALGIIQHWRDLKGEELSVVHDASSNMAKEKWLWDAVVSPEVPAQLVGYDERTMKFPLGVTETVFGDSKLHRQLQICDVLAGALAAWASPMTKLHNPDKSDYCNNLDRAGIQELLFGAIWPAPEVKRLKKPPASDTPADPLDFFANIVNAARRKQP